MVSFERGLAMHAILSKYWWTLALRGVLAILFGLVLLFAPGLALITFVLFFAAYALADGILTAIAALTQRTQKNWWVHLLEGIVSVIAGIVAFVYPGITLLVLLTIFAIWAILTGVFEIWAAVELRKEIENEWLLGLSGGASILFGLLLLIRPGTTLLAVSIFLSFYLIAFGVLLIVLAFQMRGRGSQRASA